MSDEMTKGRGQQAPAWLRSSVERIEGSEQLDAVAGQLGAVAAPLSSGRAGEVLHGRWLGHALHPLLTDFPLGCWLASALLDLVGGRSSRRSSRRLIGLGLLFSVPTAAAGLADWSTAGERDPKVRRLGVVHGLGNLAVGACYFRSWRSRRAGRHLRGMGWSFLGGSGAWVTGWIGGHMAIAYGAAEGARGLGASAGGGPGVAATGSPATAGAAAPAGDGQLLGLEEAGERLGVPTEQVRAMVDQGLLVPAGGPALRFREADVEAVRLLGG